MVPVSSTVSIPQTIDFLERRRHARLRQSLHESDAVSADITDADDNGWITLSKRSSSGFEIVSKRREANARERLRVKNLNSGFAKLRRILPTVPPNRKPSKVDTLQGAIDYIYQLGKVLESSGGIPNIKKKIGVPNHTHSRRSVTERPFFDDEARNLRITLPPRRYSPSSMRQAIQDVDTRSKIYPVAEFSMNKRILAGFPQIPVSGCLSYSSDDRRSCSNFSSGFPSPTSSTSSEENHICTSPNCVQISFQNVEASRSSNDVTSTKRLLSSSNLPLFGESVYSNQPRTLGLGRCHAFTEKVTPGVDISVKVCATVARGTWRPEDNITLPPVSYFSGASEA